MSALEELQDAARTVAVQLGSAIVSIGRDGRGSGVVVADGQVLTCAHNLRDRTTQVTFADGRTAQGEVLAADTDGDLAVLGVDTAGATPAQWAPEPPGDGQVVFGAARGQGLRVTFGLVSGTDRTFRGPRGRRVAGSVEHTAPLARGSTGGALADAQGRVLAINTLRLGDRFALAQPADQAFQDRVARLAAGEAPSRRRLGVALAPSHVARRLRASVGLPERAGLLVRGVEDGSPAAEAGIEAGDVIVAIDGYEVTDARTAQYRLTTRGVGNRTRLDVVRKGKHSTVDIALRPAPAPGRDDVRNLAGQHPFDGARVGNILPGVTDELGLEDEDGVVVLSVRAGSTAGRLGFKQGDVIVQVGRQKIATVTELETALKDKPQLWQVVVKRGTQSLQLQIPG